ncbi:MAG TPA: glycosyltransferase, partial [Candidatus Moranbacteria bacterium]|nr:glycosyltransferase [Candidatus Moranbacteria bacterium]
MKKSVLFLVQNLPVPQDRRVWMEAKTLRENGFLVSVISPRKKDQKKKEEIDGIHIYRYLEAPKAHGYMSYFWEYLYSYLMTFYLAIKIYFKRGFSIIHTANPPDFFFSIALIFRLFGVKFVYDQHDLMPEMMLCKFYKNKDSFFYKLLLMFERLSYKTCAVHIATCRSGQEKVLSRVKIKPKNFIVRSAPDLGQINMTLVNELKSKEAKKRFSYLGAYIGVM